MVGHQDVFLGRPARESDVEGWPSVTITYPVPLGPADTVRQPRRTHNSTVSSRPSLPKELVILVDKCKRIIYRGVALFARSVLQRIRANLNTLPKTAVVPNRGAWCYVLYELKSSSSQ